MNSMQTKQQDLLQSQTNVEETHKENSSKELIERIRIDGTPFTATKYGEEWHLMMGRYRLNKEPIKTYADIIEYMEIEKWNIVLMIAAIIEENPSPKGQKVTDTIKKG